MVVGGLAACGDDDDGATDPDPSSEPTESDRVLVLMSDSGSSLVPGEPGRIPLGVGDASGALVEDAPATLAFTVQDVDGNPVETGIEVARRDAGLPRSYYPLLLTTPEPGFYRAVTEVDGSPVDAAFEVRAVEEIAIPRPGQPLPPTPTPTVGDPRCVDPICTQEPPCPLHEVGLESVLGTSPTAVLVSTPAFCQTAICGPVLDLFVEAQAATPDVTFIHVEVYESAEEVEAEGPEATLAPAVAAWQLPYEPCLFLVAADGTVAERLDVIYDSDELAEALARLTA
ncbi:hypothetical protein HC251_21340 [Iamia sp. SCSIO 61187]|uniref:hypothetical protein n=1 Tax=Iamia sp. SCSIO 61187 TaxID=2722752 RepID=UPI001C63B018|nr:hypothetical protein [Iamia sp. SCSIO 61187]QYG94727.1 hypothetical protein HC251_21340 [Iamia sp. SCSIO 61187]